MTAPAGGVPAAGGARAIARPVAAADTLALTIGARLTGSTLVVACVLTLVIGASSLLGTLQQLDRSLKEMSGELEIAQTGLTTLSKTMDSLPPTATHLGKILVTIDGTAKEVDTSAASIHRLDTNTRKLNSDLGGIAANTTNVSESLANVDRGSGTLEGTITNLSGKLDPLVESQHATVGQLARMRQGLGGMNASLAYVVRVLNYITQPPTGQGFTVRVDLPKEALPPIPGVKVATDPVPVFPRQAWPTYTGP